MSSDDEKMYISNSCASNHSSLYCVCAVSNRKLKKTKTSSHGHSHRLQKVPARYDDPRPKKEVHERQLPWHLCPVRRWSLDTIPYNISKPEEKTQEKKSRIHFCNPNSYLYLEGGSSRLSNDAS